MPSVTPDSMWVLAPTRFEGQFVAMSHHRWAMLYSAWVQRTHPTDLALSLTKKPSGLWIEQYRYDRFVGAKTEAKACQQRKESDSGDNIVPASDNG